MDVTVAKREGHEVPEEWRILGFPAIWIVSIDGEPMGIFFSETEAFAYMNWLEWRIEQELQAQQEQDLSPPGVR